MPDLKRSYRGFLWNAAGRSLEYALLYVLSILIARGLGVQQNGTYATLISLAQMALVLSSLGMETALHKTIPQIAGAETEGRIRSLLLRAAGLRLILVLLAGGAIFIITGLFATEAGFSLRSYLLLLLAYAGLRSLTTLFNAALTALFRTDIVSLTSVAARVVELSGLLVMGYLGFTVGAVLTLFVTTGGLQLLAALLLLRRVFWGPRTPEPFRPLVVFGAVLWINVLVDFFLTRHGDILLLTGLTADTVPASMYDVAFSLTQMAALGLTLGFGGVALATFARLAVGPREEIEAFYAFMLRLLSFLTVPLYTFLLFNASALVRLFYSPAFTGAAILVQGMALFKIAGRLVGGGENTEYLLARGRVGWISTIGVIAAAINIGLDLLLIPRYGAFGAVLGSGIANVTVNVLARVLLLNYSSVSLQIASWSKVLGVSLLSSWVASLLFASDGLPGLAERLGVFAAGTLVLVTIAKPFSAGDLDLVGTFSLPLARRMRSLAVQK